MERVFTLKLPVPLKTIELNGQKTILKSISKEDGHLQRKGY